MAAKQQPAAEEGGGESVGLWYVSFSDMITLLLSFFVMLATFSSYSKEAVNKLVGACAYAAAYAVFPGRPNNSLMPTEKYVEPARDGSEKPTGADPSASRNMARRAPAPPRSDDAAYRDRKVLFIPSSQLFYGQGTALTSPGRQQLGCVAEFLKKFPCQMIISECRSTQDPARSLERAWAVREFFASAGQLPSSWFSVSASPRCASNGSSDQPVVQILLLSQGAAK